MHILSNLSRSCIFRSRRESSWDRSGKNDDFISIKRGKREELANIAGSGYVKHIWITLDCSAKYHLRKIVLRMFWDNEEKPSVEVPLGDFFCVGHGKVSHYWSLPLNMVTNDDPNFNRAGMNCFFPMPFSQRARIEVLNQCEEEVRALYYHIDYEKHQHIPKDELRFHAQWCCQNPCDGYDVSSSSVKEVWDVSNLTGEGNYILLEADGHGHYVGCNLSIHNLHPESPIDWFGEGDDMIFINGEEFPPSLHGTGTEDYFCAAWGLPSGKYSTPFHGISLAGSTKDWSGKWTLYRFHLLDPIVFEKSIKVSIEHGHANNRSDDWSSVAYWYQKEPHKTFPPLPPVGKRLPQCEGRRSDRDE